MEVIVVIANLAGEEILLLVNTPKCQEFHTMEAMQII
jgi:hypothetical protein